MGRKAKAVAEERFRPAAVARRTYQVYQDVIAAERGLTDLAPNRDAEREIP
jgi:hypothetical protein